MTVELYACLSRSSPDKRRKRTSGLGFLLIRLAGSFFGEEDCFGHTGYGWGFDGGWPSATEFLPLEDDVGKDQREGDASPAGAGPGIEIPNSRHPRYF